jgi:AcrR family transcriptional regulator
MLCHMATASLAARASEQRFRMVVSELEAVALQLFADRGFDRVTVDDIAGAAGISVRTFYRYFPTKDAVLQVQIDRRSEALRAALDARPAGEAPLESLRTALHATVADEDMELLRRWNTVIAATPSVLRAVLGGLQLKRNGVIAEFLAARLGVSPNSLVPTALAGAVGGVIQSAQTQWLLEGGDLATTIAESLDVLERGIGWDRAATPADTR